MNEYNCTMYLFERIRWAVDSAIEDAAEIGDQLADRIIQTETGVRIITRLTRNASQSSNGGDYTYWTDFSSVDEGVLESEDWSADFNAADWLSEPYLHQVDYTPEEIWLYVAERIASHLTRARQRRTDRRASMIAPDSTPQPVYTYESAAYRAARQREQVAAIMAAMRDGRTAREIVGDDEGEEQGDGLPTR